MKLKIGAHNFTVERLSRQGFDLGERWGDTNKLTNTIRIVEDGPATQQAETLIHEVIHACFSVWGIKDKGLLEEDVATHLGAALACVIRDNPELMPTLGELLASRRGLFPALEAPPEASKRRPVGKVRGKRKAPPAAS